MNVGHPSNLARLVALYGGVMNEKGELLLELLQFVYSDLALLDNEDTSILNIQFSGRIQAVNANALTAIEAEEVQLLPM